MDTTLQTKKDSDQLQLLTIFHFIVAGLGFLGIGFLCVHYLIMSTFMDDPRMWAQMQKQQQGPPFDPQVFFHAFRWFYLFMGGCFIVFTLLNIASGLCLWKRCNRLFSLVVAGINCANFPFGTALGVFTIIVLLRDSVQTLYRGVPPFPGAKT